MSGAILFGISSIGKSYLVDRINHPALLDADVLISADSGLGFPKQQGWWKDGVLEPEVLQQFGEDVYAHLTRRACEGWILTGIGPVPEWVWDLPESGIDVKFIVTTKERLASNLATRDASSGQAVDLDEIWDAYTEFLNIAASKGIEMIQYDKVEDKFKHYLKQRRVSHIDARCVWTDDDNQYVHFTWNSRPFVVDVTGSIIHAHKKIAKTHLTEYFALELTPTLAQARFVEPGTDEWITAVSKVATMFRSLQRTI